MTMQYDASGAAGENGKKKVKLFWLHCSTRFNLEYKLKLIDLARSISYLYPDCGFKFALYFDGTAKFNKQ